MYCRTLGFIQHFRLDKCTVYHLSHLSAKGIQKIEESPLEFVVSTDTLECPDAGLSSKIRFISAAPMFAQAVKIVHDRTPMSSLFEQRVNKRMMDMSFMDQPTLLKD